jgi:hypothetical protein
MSVSWSTNIGLFFNGEKNNSKKLTKMSFFWSKHFLKQFSTLLAMGFCKVLRED